MSIDRIIINVADFVCLAGFVLALALFARTRSDARSFPRSAKVALCVAMGLYAFVASSNILEWTGVTRYFDLYEDFAEMLFLPLIAYSVYTVGMTLQVDAARQSGEAIRSEHDLLTAIVDTTPTGILVVAPDGVLTYANDPAREMLGITESPDTGWLTLDPEVRIGGQRSDWMPVRQAFNDMVAGPRLRDAIRFVMRPDGSTISLSVSTNSFGQSPSSAAVVAVQDITERMRYRQDLERMVSERTEELVELNRQLGKANEAKREFLAKMSHELRTPLNSVIGFTGIMIDGMSGPLSDEQLKQLTMVRRAGRQLLDIVDDVLDIARIESGKAAVTYRPVEVADFAREVVELMRPDADERGLSLQLDLADDLGSVRTDAGKLGQVLRNLVSNAIKFTDADGSVTVAVRRPDGTVEFAVSDTGIGIPPECAEQVFEPFAQIDTPDRMKPPGAGLGLAVSRDLIGLLGGSITLESEPGRGSTFRVRVPGAPS